MAFWWVNHKQTYQQETSGGYIWSPKTRADGRRNVTYDNLTWCRQGDVVFSDAHAKIQQIGLVEAEAVSVPKPPEFGKAGDAWGDDGWLVRINWGLLREPWRPLTFFEQLGTLLLQLIEDHADADADADADSAVQVLLLTLSEEASEANDFLADVQELQAVPHATEREALTKARLGQGLFRKRVAQLEPCCRVTGLVRQEFLVASHIKPWRDCSNSERLNGANGLLLSPHLGKLFDRHWISFDSSGELIWRHEAAGEALNCWGIKRAHVLRPFSREQEGFLELHRDGLRG